jgi:iron complex transport system permease protein
MKNRALILSLLLIFALLSIFFSLMKGSTSVSYDQVFTALFGKGEALDQDIIWQLRLPRTWSAFVTGGLLALAGSLMQILLRNPLADPYVLGISGGAALGTLLCLFCGLGGLWLIGSAWLGALMAISLTLFLVKGQLWQTSRLLLTGISLACASSALITVILLAAPDRVLHNLLFWLIGDLNEARLPIVETLLLFCCLGLATYFAPALNLLCRGEKEAQALGLATSKLQGLLYVLSSLLTAAAVTLAGCIGFIGLLAPHLLRLFLGYDHRFLLPAAVIFGGSLLTLADLLARTVIAPQQLPVGVVMTFLGVPLFLILLEKKKLL